MEELRTRTLLRESRLSQLRSLRWSLEESWRQRKEYLRGGSEQGCQGRGRRNLGDRE